MKVRLAVFAWLLAADVGQAQAPDYVRLAEASFAKEDFDTARRNLRLALAQTSDVPEQIALRRKIAVTYVFEDELDDARGEYRDIIGFLAKEKLPPEAHDYYALAAIAALQKKQTLVERHVAQADSLAPGNPTAPMFHAIVWGHLGDLERVQRARAEMEATTVATPRDTTVKQAAALTRAIYAINIRAFDVAREEMRQLTIASMRAFATAFMANSIRSDGERVRAVSLIEEVRKAKQMNIYSAIAWAMVD